ncbi:MAG: hypothetical protein RL701_4554, partial [Pseudomonadota bacterium]
CNSGRSEHHDRGRQHHRHGPGEDHHQGEHEIVCGAGAGELFIASLDSCRLQSSLCPGRCRSRQSIRAPALRHGRWRTESIARDSCHMPNINVERRPSWATGLRRIHALANVVLAACAAKVTAELALTGAATSRFGIVLLVLLVPGGLFCLYGAFTALAGRASAVFATALGAGAGGMAWFLIASLGEGMSR